MRYEAIVIGVSSGGLNAMKVMFTLLPKDFSIPIVIVQHIGPRSDNQWIKLVNDKNKFDIKEADEKEKIENGRIYVAPPNYHLLIERSKTFSLTIDERVNFARPSIDVLFESAAEVYRDKLIGVVLTGSNADGTNGMKRIKKYGGLTIVQDPATAESSYMPASVMATMPVDHISPLDGIVNLLIGVTGPKR
ncbi:two-component system, chemotaxis family, response regulator CheB [Chryseolinea serpens]|uniref:protein-glutamate methylesterase n=1 Tax=Chryseolinea serpens TaxID=947013 RepID=A0A1M5MKI5_9BACT|nr:chemotaxis protein CheB [Chryseolinea serpens]SHG77707.1 two-component system, chemotaxis family, response regulator CheB [Chryseolinea serpens]